MSRPVLPFGAPEPPEAGPLSVTELSARIKSVLEDAFGRVLVEGEISNCKPWSSGHLYFTLKDERSQIRAVMFRSAVRFLKFRPEDGLRVIARGRLGLYEPKGEYQIICDTLDPHGLGALQAAFDQLKRRLAAEGLFDAGRKRPLPLLPRRIGIVTSLDGAALRDMLRVLTLRHPSARVVIRAARVQGPDAPRHLVRALGAIARVPDLDVVIVARGGGSAEDLRAFNDEAVARAIAACPVPVISGVGHETDVTIADFVADVRAATPSNAAEIVVDRADNFRARIDRAEERLRRALELFTTRRGQAVERQDTRLRQWPAGVLLRQRDIDDLERRARHGILDGVGRLRASLDRLTRRLERRDVRRIMAENRTRVVSAEGRLRELVVGRTLSADARISSLAGRLNALSPLAVLGRGYAVCWNEARTTIIRSAGAVRPGAGVRVTLAKGELACRVEETTGERRARDGT